MPLRRSRLCIGNTRGAACTFSAETIGEPRGVFDPQQRCYFCDPALQRDASETLRPWLVGALTELFVLDTDIYEKALSLIAFRPGEDEPEIRRRVRARLSTLAVASRSFSAQQIKQARATTALQTMLRECAEGHETQRAIRNAGREIARVEPLRKVLKEQLALTLSFLADVDGLTDRLRLAQAEVKRIGFGLPGFPGVDRAPYEPGPGAGPVLLVGARGPLATPAQTAADLLGAFAMPAPRTTAIGLVLD